MIGQKKSAERRYRKMIDEKKIKEGVKLLLEGIGEDVEREGLKDTPDRIARMYTEIFAGYEDDAANHLSKRFHVDNNDIVLEKNIVFYSTCEHHMMPFYGVAHIAYIPNNEVVGISKLARTLEVYARRLQIQEKLTDEVADSIFNELNAKGVMVVIEAEHMCMTMRGIKKPGSKTVTMSSRGLFEKEEYKNRFFDLLRI